MKALLTLVLLAGCASAQRADLTAQALELHCTYEVLAPLVPHPENVTAAQLLDAIERIKACSAVADAGPAH